MTNLKLPTIAELQKSPLKARKEAIAAICFQAGLADNGEVLAEAEMLAMDPDPRPEKIVELWNRLRGEADVN